MARYSHWTSWLRVTVSNSHRVEAGWALEKVCLFFILFYFTLFYFILLDFILFYYILFYFVLLHFILFYFTLFYFILFYFILFCFILFYFILFCFFYFILFYFILFEKRKFSCICLHSSPKPSCTQGTYSTEYSIPATKISLFPSILRLFERSFSHKSQIFYYHSVIIYHLHIHMRTLEFYVTRCSYGVHLNTSTVGLIRKRVKLVKVKVK